MQTVAEATVIKETGMWGELQIIEVKLAGSGETCEALHIYAHSQPCSVGERVLVNTTAVRLGLGTGGYHIVVSKLDAREEADWQPSSWGHVMKLRYTPFQLVVPAVEEQESPYHRLFLDPHLQTLSHTPVVIGELHSLLPVLCLAVQMIAREQSICNGLRLVYVMPDGAALPISLSRHVSQLRKSEALTASITTGHAWGGDLDAVNMYTGLLAAKHVAKADMIVCLLGPGVVGTGTTLGFSAMQLAEVLHAVSMLKGVPIFIPRMSFADQRERHRGISHHTLTLLSRYTLASALVPIPRFPEPEKARLLAHQLQNTKLEERHVLLHRDVPPVDRLLTLQREYPLRIETMGRSIEDDSAPFLTAFHAAEVAVHLFKRQLTSVASLSESGGQEALVRYYGALLAGAM